MGLKKDRGYDVDIFTCAYSEKNCFEECRLLKIHEFGSFIPRIMFGLFRALLSYLKSALLSLYFCLCHDPSSFDVILVDQIPIPMMVIKIYLHLKKKVHRKTSLPLMSFYCHFPDRLLCRKGGMLKKIYRMPIDKLEECALFFADTIYFNSEFTLSKFKHEFPALVEAFPPDSLRVLYPGVALLHGSWEKRDGCSSVSDSGAVPSGLAKFSFLKSRDMLLSLNRFEAKKNIDRALYLSRFIKDELDTENFCLIVSGGYDGGLFPENKAVFDDLKRLSCSLNLRHEIIWNSETLPEKDLKGVDVLFMPNISSEVKMVLLQQARALFYTPSYEHFGIVPIEAMGSGCVVVAMESGGPVETISHLNSGYLIPEPKESFCDFLEKDGSDLACFLKKVFSNGHESIRTMRMCARESVEKRFSATIFISTLDSLLRGACAAKKKTPDLVPYREHLWLRSGVAAIGLGLVVYFLATGIAFLVVDSQP